jgi:hypothetical protein
MSLRRRGVELGDATSYPPKGFVYFIQVAPDGPVKIGYSSTKDGVQKRLNSLQTGNPDKLIVRKVVPGSRWVEQGLHRRFEKWRMEGEWFMATVEVASEAGCPDMKRGNPYRRYLPLIDKAYEAGYEAGEAEAHHHVCERLERLDEIAANLHCSMESFEDIRAAARGSERAKARLDRLREAADGSQMGHKVSVDGSSAGQIAA